MKTHAAILAGAAFCLGSVFAAAQDAPAKAPERIAANIDVRQTAPPVSKYEYGMFIEHIGNLIYRSLWSEMLDDRKFYFPITSQEAAPPGGRQGGGFRGMQLRKWRPIGPDEVVTMDKSRPFVGDSSPRIELVASTPHGIRQSGLALLNGKRYTGRIYLRGTPGSRIKVSLVWGAEPGDRQTVSFAALSGAYRKFPLSFTSHADTDNGIFEIAGTGSGNFHVGTVSLMPADNIEGFRPEVISQLRRINSGFWRFGGNFTSGFIWYHSVGDRDRRPPDFDHAWNAMQTNDVGLDEFATLCRLLGVEPYISVNAGFGDSHSAAEEVEYMNGSAQTRLGAMRARNGHPAPYHVKFWNIGNEPWGAWQLGRTDLKYFVLKHNEFAKAMRAVDPSITLIASGEMLEDGNLPGDLRAKYAGNLGPLYGSDVDWTGGFLAHCWGNFDGIAQHWYAQPGRHYDIQRARSLPPTAPNDQAYVKVDQTLLEFARYPANLVEKQAEEWQGYRQRFPAMLAGKTFMSVDEYAYFGGGFNRAPDIKLALAYGMIFNEMLRHTDSMTMAAHTTGVSMVTSNRTAAVMNTTGLLFQLYSHRFVGAIPVALSGNSPQPAPQYPPGGDQPEKSSGSSTYPLDMFAALSPDRRFLDVAVVNATESEQAFDLNVAGANLAGPSQLWRITGKSLDAANRVGQPPQVEIEQTAIGEAPHSLTVAPISINVYQFPLAQAAR
jgi:alpha-N-arabinofuranosidase